eukprot:215568_1
MSFVLLFTIITTYLQHSHSYLPLSQISALNDLYESLQGDKWTTCQWNLTFLATENKLPGLYCGLEINESSLVQTITGINFEDNNLNGTLSSSISEFTDLSHISIYDNSLLNGTIPHSMCKLKHLHSISFRDVNLSGNVPECIGNMSSIRGIELSHIPSLTMRDKIITSLCDHSYLYSIVLQSINYIG